MMVLRDKFVMSGDFSISGDILHIFPDAIMPHSSCHAAAIYNIDSASQLIKLYTVDLLIHFSILCSILLHSDLNYSVHYVTMFFTFCFFLLFFFYIGGLHH